MLLGRARDRCLASACLFAAALVCGRLGATETEATSGAEAEARERARDASSDDLLDLDIDQLTTAPVVVPSFDQPITSVTRTESTVGRSPAAVFVITQEMIRRSGVTSIPEALRMAPGLMVAKNNANQWAITSRGFNSVFSSNLLVLMDGRAVYTPFFNGVYWEVLDYPLQDIERIEVIRGPGATIWGENAVNGVINIITKSSRETQGSLVSAGGGSVDQAITSIRYGGETEHDWTYRVFARQTERGPGYLPTGAHDDWRLQHIGFRADRLTGSDAHDEFTLQGDLYTSGLGESGLVPAQSPPYLAPFANDVTMSGGNVLFRWSRTSDASSSFLQAYYDRFHRGDPQFNQLAINTFDVEYQNRVRIMPGNHVTIGANFRRYLDEFTSDDPYVVDVAPHNDNYGRVGGTIQDEIELFEGRMTVFAGTKLSTNTFTGFQVQPGIRALYLIDAQRAAWASVSRAVRLPSRVERGVHFNAFDPATPAYVTTMGDPNVESQDLMAYELGYRSQPSERFSWEIAGFYNVYTDIIGVAYAGLQPGGPPLFIPTYLFQFGNTNDATTYGTEINVTFDVTDDWRLRGWYSAFELFASGAGEQTTLEGSCPQNQAYVMSSWNLPRNCEFDLMGRYVDSLWAQNVKPYFSLDARLGWRPNSRWEISLVGQNLLQEHHQEFNEYFAAFPTQVPRGVYVQAVFQH